MIIIPAIDIKDGRCVRLVQGEMDKETVFNENPAAQAKKWEDGGAKIIHLVDLDGALAGKPVNGEEIKEICRTVDCTVQLGGGIRNMETAQIYFDIGVDRIVIGSLLTKNPGEARTIAEKHPKRIIAGIDAKNGRVAVDGWTETSDISALDLADRMADWPLGGIIFTDISRDGMMQGANIPSIREMAEKSAFPVIASGGVTSEDDLKELAKIPGIDGVIIGRALFTGDIDLAKAIKSFQC